MIPVYVAEMATQKELRGRGVNGMIAAASVGVSLAYWVSVIHPELRSGDTDST